MSNYTLQQNSRENMFIVKVGEIGYILTINSNRVGEASSLARKKLRGLLSLAFSGLVAKSKKLLYTVDNPACGLLNRENR